MDVAEILDDEREHWPKQFGGGMVAFDTLYFDALREGVPEIEAWERGVSAVLDAFVDRLKQRLAESEQETTVIEPLKPYDWQAEAAFDDEGGD